MRGFNWSSDQSRIALFDAAKEFMCNKTAGLLISPPDDGIVNYSGKNHNFGPNIGFNFYKDHEGILYIVEARSFSKGSFGSVYYAEDQDNNPWVFKISQCKEGSKEEIVALNEEKISCDQLNESKCQWIATPGSNEKTQHLISPYYGQDLHSHIVELEERQPKIVGSCSILFDCYYISLAMKACAALAGLHKRGFAHLDVKPENMAIDSHADLRLFDYGFTRKINEPIEASKFNATPLFLLPPDGGNGYRYCSYLNFDVFALLRTIYMPKRLKYFDKNLHPCVSDKKDTKHVSIFMSISEKTFNHFPKSLQDMLALADGEKDYIAERLPSILKLYKYLAIAKFEILAKESIGFKLFFKDVNKKFGEIKTVPDFTAYILAITEDYLQKCIEDVVKADFVQEDAVKQWVCHQFINALKHERHTEEELRLMLLKTLRVLSHERWSFRSDSNRLAIPNGLYDSFFSLAGLLGVDGKDWANIFTLKPGEGVVKKEYTYDHYKKLFEEAQKKNQPSVSVAQSIYHFFFGANKNADLQVESSQQAGFAP